MFAGTSPFAASEHDLRDFLVDDGRSLSTMCIVPDWASGRSRGFGLVELDTGTHMAATVSGQRPAAAPPAAPRGQLIG